MIEKIELPALNAMAAAQIIHRPYNAIKQLTENSIDAHATDIHIRIEEGGSRLLEITDNGAGIPSSAFPLLCKRFTTTKIQAIQDLSSLQSFGFRGEALASLSHVSDLQIASCHQGTRRRCAFKDEILQQELEECTLPQGTKITARNMYKGLSVRRASLNATEEKRRIIKLVQHFMLHYPNVRFVVQSQKGVDVISQGRGQDSRERQMTIFQHICDLPYDKFLFAREQKTPNILSIKGILTKLNACKSKTLLLNVNHRIVENEHIAKTVSKAYSDCYQSIYEEQQNYFAYVALNIDPKRIDCNKNPSKKMIGFIEVEAICKDIYEWVTFNVQEQSSIKEINCPLSSKGKAMSNIGLIPKNNQFAYEEKTARVFNTHVYDKSINRTDSKQLPLGFYVTSIPSLTNSFKYQVLPLLSPETYLQAKKFFQTLTFVGCFNLNYIFIHRNNSLFLMNLVPFIPIFLSTYLKSKPLLYKQAQINLQLSLDRFIKQKNLQNKVNLLQTLKKLQNQQKLKKLKQYGLSINSHELLTFPVLFEEMNITQDELSYFLLRFLKQEGPFHNQTYFFDLLSTAFINNQNHLSPYNNIYAQFIGVNIIPLLKSKCNFTQNINPYDYISPLLDLEDVYKIFERC